jgi:hypothetical protein
MLAIFYGGKMVVFELMKVAGGSCNVTSLATAG